MARAQLRATLALTATMAVVAVCVVAWTTVEHPRNLLEHGQDLDIINAGLPKVVFKVPHRNQPPLNDLSNDLSWKEVEKVESGHILTGLEHKHKISAEAERLKREKRITYHVDDVSAVGAGLEWHDHPRRMEALKAQRAAQLAEKKRQAQSMDPLHQKQPVYDSDILDKNDVSYADVAKIWFAHPAKKPAAHQAKDRHTSHTSSKLKMAAHRTKVRPRRKHDLSYQNDVSAAEVAKIVGRAPSPATRTAPEDGNDVTAADVASIERNTR